MSTLIVHTGSVAVSAAAVTFFVSVSVIHCAVDKHDRQMQPCGVSSVISCSLLDKDVTVKASLAEWGKKISWLCWPDNNGCSKALMFQLFGHMLGSCRHRACVEKNKRTRKQSRSVSFQKSPLVAVIRFRHCGHLVHNKRFIFIKFYHDL